MARHRTFNATKRGSSPRGPTKVLMSLNRLVLVINASYEPINICSARRAMTLVLKGAAVVQEVSAYVVRTSKITLPVPSVVRLQKYRRVPRQNRAVSRKGILFRDGYMCQYCRFKFAPARLTLDHVIPRSRGGSSTWENLVACCHPCNRRKGNHLLIETDMKLFKEPRPFTLHTSRHIMRMIGRSDNKWRKYLFY